MPAMQFRFSFRDELLADADRERQVGEVVAMQVSDFAIADMKKDHASAVDVDSYAVPGSHLPLNTFRDRFPLHHAGIIPAFGAGKGAVRCRGAEHVSHQSRQFDCSRGNRFCRAPTAMQSSLKSLKNGERP
jgi:hypothetical protein